MDYGPTDGRLGPPLLGPPVPWLGPYSTVPGHQSAVFSFHAYSTPPSPASIRPWNEPANTPAHRVGN